jgi:hypothetical protein
MTSCRALDERGDATTDRRKEQWQTKQHHSSEAGRKGDEWES